MSAEVSKRNIVVFTGAGMSAESGLQTFRGDGGLWEGHRVEDVATPEAWAKDPALVLEFYNERRRKVRAATPNAAHRALVDLETAYDVRIVTQADIFFCVDTSLQVYPANSLIFATPRRTRRIVVNPEVPDLVPGDICECTAKTACEGMPELVASLLRPCAPSSS
ncbi:MAG: Sir2 family NAD-dependent protein deacetylase [Pirellulales bacterium]